MADLSKDDVKYAVRDALGDARDDIKRLHSDVQKIEQRTNDLDESQAEIKRLVERLDRVSQQVEEVYHDADKIDRVMVEMTELRTQLQNSNQYLQQVSGYLGALDGRFRAQFGDEKDDEGYRKA